MGKALDFRAWGPRFKSHLSQYLPNFYWNFLKSGITGHGQIMCFFKILRSRAFRICGQSVWELKIHKIRRQRTVSCWSFQSFLKLALANEKANLWAQPANLLQAILKGEVGAYNFERTQGLGIFSNKNQ